MPEPWLHSILPSSVLALGLVAALGMFFSLKREIPVQARKHRAELEALNVRINSLAAPPPEPVDVVAPFPPRSGFNLSRRVQAMRLFRRGEDPGHIAAALGVPEKEVELLIRVQQMAAEPATPR